MLELLLFFYMTFLTGNLEILLKYLLISSYYFFKYPDGLFLVRKYALIRQEWKLSSNTLDELLKESKLTKIFFNKL